jgi:hypothetical protein
MLPGAAALITLFSFGMIRQLGFGIPFGGDPMPDTVLRIVGPFMMLLGCALAYLFIFMRLVVTVRRDGLYIRYVPFVRRIIHFTEIERCEARTYSPFKEYGGWGIRGGKKRRAYNVRGNRGVMLHFKNGTSLLIGSWRANELADAIKSMM